MVLPCCAERLALVWRFQKKSGSSSP
ncbi:unnamed protein product [Ectocarpus sp. CCAP 1310/34]|nr:unnamed protein product [Ectocarpus sp. CCAP 1310/34]